MAGIFRRFVLVVVLLAGAVAGATPPLGAAEEPPPTVPGRCWYRDGAVHIEPHAVLNDAMLVVERSRDGGRFWWRHRFADEAEGFFSDPVAWGHTYEYRVRSTDPTLYSPWTCGIVDRANQSPPPASCSVSVRPFGLAEVRIESAPFVYERVLVLRSVNSGPTYWRGRASGVGYLPDVYEFGDYSIQGIPTQYYAIGVGANGKRSEPTACGEPVDFQPPPPPSCSFRVHPEYTRIVTELGPDQFRGAMVVYRRLGQDAPTFWRGRVEGRAFSEFEDSTPGWVSPDVIEYEVVFVTPTGHRSVPTVCEARPSRGGVFEDATTIAELVAHPAFEFEYGNAFRVYNVMFDREPTVPEALAAIDVFVARNGVASPQVGAQAVSAVVGQSAEFAERYGNATDEEYVYEVLTNASGAEPSAAWQSLWTGDLERGLGRTVVAGLVAALDTASSHHPYA